MTTSTLTARRRGDPQHYVEGKKEIFGVSCFEMMIFLGVNRMIPKSSTAVKTNYIQKQQRSGHFFKIDTRNHQQLLKLIGFNCQNDKRSGQFLKIDTGNQEPLLKLISLICKQKNGVGMFSKSMQEIINNRQGRQAMPARSGQPCQPARPARPGHARPDRLVH